jgi:hypothetical protein
VRPVTRRRFLTATGGILGLSAASAAAATAAAATATETAADATTAGGRDFSFTNQDTITDNYGGVQLSKGRQPAAGRVWQVRRVFWNVNLDGVVADGVQTYLYRLPASWTTAMAHTHMESSLDGWLGCCGNSGLTGNGDMQFDAGDLLIRPGQYLWIWFITPLMTYNNWVMAAGMAGWEQAA